MATDFQKGTDAPIASVSDCVACKESIKLGASVCTHCGSVQNWTRHILRWSALGAALVAIIPLWSAAWSLREFIPRRADLRVIPIACTISEVKLAVTNLGSQPGIIEQSQFQWFVDGASKPVEIELEIGERQLIIRPGEASILTLKPAIGGVPANLPKRPPIAKDCYYQITFNATDFESNKSTLEVNCPCPKL